MHKHSYNDNAKEKRFTAKPKFIQTPLTFSQIIRYSLENDN